MARATYHSHPCPDAAVASSANPDYWKQLYDKFGAIHGEIQDASRSINKSFGIFNEQTLRHCSSNIAHDCEGYKSLIARPYESVNRAMPGSYYSDVERTIYLTYVVLVEDIAKYDELFQQERKFISFEYWSEHVRQLDYDDLVYGHDRLSELVDKHPATKAGLSRFLYEIILRRMEIRDRSRSVNSIDVVFNFDCIGFTGTPFIDNYPTFAYIRNGREDEVPDLIDRSFYAYSSDKLSTAEFEERFTRFQGQNNNVFVEYVSSDFVTDAHDELAVLGYIFTREAQQPSGQGANKNPAMAATADGASSSARARAKTAVTATQMGWDVEYPETVTSATATGDMGASGAVEEEVTFNALVDLCGIFKRSSIHEVRDLVLQRFGPDRFHYVYHIDQADGSDRVLSINSDNDVQFDEEFYKHLCKRYGAELRHRVFFFVDNRNVIGKDIPFQLVYQRRFGQPLFTKSVVLAHDMDDFSKIWQAMGRSRTMNQTRFAIYKTGIKTEGDGSELVTPGGGDIKKQGFTRHLYEHNCDCKMAGNLSSVYQTLIALLNMSQEQFYYTDDIVNVFLEKMEMTISGKVRRHIDQLSKSIFGRSMPAKILAHILTAKFRKSSMPAVADHAPGDEVVKNLLGQIVHQKYEQRVPTGDVYDDFIRFLSGEQVFFFSYCNRFLHYFLHFLPSRVTFCPSFESTTHFVRSFGGAGEPDGDQLHEAAAEAKTEAEEQEPGQRHHVYVRQEEPAPPLVRNG